MWDCKFCKPDLNMVLVNVRLKKCCKLDLNSHYPLEHLEDSLSLESYNTTKFY